MLAILQCFLRHLPDCSLITGNVRASMDIDRKVPLALIVLDVRIAEMADCRDGGEDAWRGAIDARCRLLPYQAVCKWVWHQQGHVPGQKTF